MNINKIITILLLSVLSLSLSAQKKTPTKKNTQTQTEIPAYETIEYTMGLLISTTGKRSY